MNRKNRKYINIAVVAIVLLYVFFPRIYPVFEYESKDIATNVGIISAAVQARPWHIGYGSGPWNCYVAVFIEDMQDAWVGSSIQGVTLQSNTSMHHVILSKPNHGISDKGIDQNRISYGGFTELYFEDYTAYVEIVNASQSIMITVPLNRTNRTSRYSLPIKFLDSVMQNN